MASLFRAAKKGNRKGRKHGGLFSYRRAICGEQLESRRLLTIAVEMGTDDWVVAPDGPNGERTAYLPVDTTFSVDIAITADPEETLLGWQLQFNHSSAELGIEEFVHDPSWIGLHQLDVELGLSLIGGADFVGVDVSNESQPLGRFTVHTPSAPGTYLLSVEAAPGTPSSDRSGFTGIFGSSVPISDYGDLLIVVDEVQPPPTVVATDDDYTTVRNTPLTFDPTDNDILPAGRLNVGTQPANGNLVVHADYTMTYTPDTDFVGVDSFEYTLKNAHSTSTATVTVDVREALNNPPSAVDDMVSTPIDVDLFIDVLDNDSDTDGDTLTVTLATPPTHGTAVVANDQRIRFFPGRRFVGQDSFTYQLRDGLDTSTATVTVDVFDGVGLELDFLPSQGDVRVNTGPNGEDVVHVESGTDLDIDMLVRSSDGDRGVVGWQVQFNNSDVLPRNFTPAFPWIPLGPFGTLYSAANFGETVIGSDPHRLASFELQDIPEGIHRVTVDEHPNTNGPEVTGFTGILSNQPILDYGDLLVVVGPVQPEVVAVVDQFDVSANQPTVLDVLQNDSSLWNVPLTVTSVSLAEFGEVVINPDGTLTYEAAPGFFGADTFNYTIEGNGYTDTATVTVFVGELPGRIVASNDTLVVHAPIAASVNVVANDFDPDGDPIAVIGLTQPTLGVVEILSSEVVQYTPFDDTGGTDSFTYTVSDGNGSTATATVHVTVLPPLSAIDDSFQVQEGVLGNFDVLSNDLGQGTLQIVNVSPATSGSVSTDGNAIFYEPAVGFSGLDAFEYVVEDAFGQTDVGTVSVEVVVDTSNENTFVQDGVNLVFRGSSGRDRINVRAGNNPNWIIIATDTDVFGPLALASGGVLHIHALGGNDDVRVAGYLDDLPTYIDGGSGNDRLVGSGGADMLVGGLGNDTLFGADGANSLAGGSGNDELRGGRDADVLVGESGNDQLLGGDDDDLLFGGEGNDRLLGLFGHDILNGEDDDDVLLGGRGNDLQIGAHGDDLVKGEQGDDLIFGGAGTDVVNGGFGDDALTGGTPAFAHDFDDRTQLIQLLAEWNEAGSIDSRVNLPGLAGVDDAARDTLIGRDDRDYFFATFGDVLADYIPSEDV